MVTSYKLALAGGSGLDELSGGRQYKVNQSIQDLLDADYIKEIKR